MKMSHRRQPYALFQRKAKYVSLNKKRCYLWKKKKKKRTFTHGDPSNYFGIAPLQPPDSEGTKTSVFSSLDHVHRPSAKSMFFKVVFRGLFTVFGFHKSLGGF